MAKRTIDLLLEKWDEKHDVYQAVKAYLGDTCVSKQRFFQLMSMLGKEINKRKPAPTIKLFK